MPVSPDLLIPLIKQRDQLEDSIYQQQKELYQINAAIKALSDDYNSENRFNWSEKAFLCIAKAGKFLQTNDILESILAGTDILSDEKKRRGCLVALSVALNNHCKNGTLRKIILNGVKGHYYGLPQWFHGATVDALKFSLLIAEVNQANEAVVVTPNELSQLNTDNAEDYIK